MGRPFRKNERASGGAARHGAAGAVAFVVGVAVAVHGVSVVTGSTVGTVGPPEAGVPVQVTTAVHAPVP